MENMINHRQTLTLSQYEKICFGCNDFKTNVNPILQWVDESGNLHRRKHIVLNNGCLVKARISNYDRKDKISFD